MQQQLDPSARYKKKLAQYSMNGHHVRGNKETKEDVSEEARKRKRESNPARDQKRVSLGLAFTRWLISCLAMSCVVLRLLDVWLC